MWNIKNYSDNTLKDGTNCIPNYDTYYQVTKEETSESTVDYTYNGRSLVSKSSDNEEYLYNNGRLIRQKIDNVYTFFEYNNEGDITFEVRWEMPENYASTVPNQYSDSLTDAEIKRYNYNNNGTQNYFIDSKEDKKTSYNYSNNGKTIVIAVYKASDSTILEKPTKNVYNVFGNLLTTSIIDEDNNEKIIVANTYDEAGKVLLSNNDGAYTRTFYDSFGRVTRQIEPIDYDSDKDHLPENKTYDDVNIGHKYYYAENGNLSKEINRLGVETEYEYYENSSTVKKETFDIYEFTYNKDGKILKSTVDGNTYAEYNYNNDGNPVSIIYNNGQSVYYNYDKDTGNLVSQHRISLENDPYVEYSYERILVTDDDEPSIDTASQLDTEPETEVTPNEHYVIKSKINYDSKLRYAYQDNGWVKVYNTDNSALVYSYLVTESDNATTTTGKNFGVSYSAKSEENGITYDYNGNKLSKTVSKDDNGTTVTISNAAGTILSYTETESDETASRTYNLNGNTLNVSENYNLNGKITSATEDNRTTNYEYYSDGQLQSVSSNDYSASYQYSKKTGTDTNDIRGNIVSKTIGTNSYTYTYDTNIKDRLTSYNGNALTYDNIGNVLTYGNESYTWSSGRSLQSIVDGNKTYSYTYNKYGYRTSKTTTTTMDIDGETTQESVTTYFNVDDNGTIISQKTNNDVMYFEYDNSGVPLGFVYNGTQYIYLTNISGDVIGIADIQGNIFARYSYDEWGKVTVNATGDENIVLANLNPLRYRGYYYDSETGYYYLQSRYYDPNICRFINADLPEYAKVQKNTNIGINVFIYCGNDAVNNSDNSGMIPVRALYALAGAALFGGVGYLIARIIGIKGWKLAAITAGLAALGAIAAATLGYRFIMKVAPDFAKWLEKVAKNTKVLPPNYSKDGQRTLSLGGIILFNALKIMFHPPHIRGPHKFFHIQIEVKIPYSKKWIVVGRIKLSGVTRWFK